MSSEKKCSHLFHWLMIIFLFIVSAISIFGNIILFIILIGLSSSPIIKDYPIDEYPKLKEIWSYGSGYYKAVHIKITGPIERTEANYFTKRDKIDEILQQIQAAEKDEKVIAILLEVNSPGGGITPSDEIYTKLIEFKKSKKGRKIVVLMKSLAASGAYYISMAGDKIIAEPTTITGSIGVIIQSLNWKKLSEKIGIKDITIKSGKNKDLLNPFKEPTQEQLDMFRTIIHEYYRRFIQIISKSRNIPVNRLLPICDGRIFTAQQALQNRLIDKIGYFPDAVESLKALCGTGNIKIIKYQEEINIFEAFFDSQAKKLGILSKLKNPLDDYFAVKYLFQP